MPINSSLDRANSRHDSSLNGIVCDGSWAPGGAVQFEGQPRINSGGVMTMGWQGDDRLICCMLAKNSLALAALPDC